jgi:hypothetical protein
MTRFPLVVALVIAMSSVASADVCVHTLTGNFVGAHILMKKVPSGRGKFGPVHGYMNYPHPDGTALVGPVIGQALVSSRGDLVIALSWHVGMLAADGSTAVQSQLVDFHLVCHPGADRKIGKSDTCDTSGEGGPAGTGSIVSCKDVVPIP